jgi:hypothetical protein
MGVREMKTMTGIVLTGLALVFAGCSNSEKAHDQTQNKANKSRGGAEITQAGVENSGAPCDQVVNQTAAKAQDAIATAQITADKAAADAHAVTANAARTAVTVTTDAERAAADAAKLQNDAARTGQDALNNAKQDLNIFKNALR